MHGLIPNIFPDKILHFVTAARREREKRRYVSLCGGSKGRGREMRSRDFARKRHRKRARKESGQVLRNRDVSVNYRVNEETDMA